jgi:hypothetical protein
MPLSSDEMFEIASDATRLARWIPSELRPREQRPSWSRVPWTPMTGDGDSGIYRSRDQRRLEWSTVLEGCHTALQISPVGQDSRVTIRVCVPDRKGVPLIRRRLQQALRRLEQVAVPTADRPA